MKKLEVEQCDDIIEAHRFLDGQEFEHFLIINTEKKPTITKSTSERLFINSSDPRIKKYIKNNKVSHRRVED